MVSVKGSEKTLDADIVLIAAGFVGCEDYVAKAFDVKLTPRGNVADENYQTNQNSKPVFFNKIQVYSPLI